jgi:hypothetical protein
MGLSLYICDAIWVLVLTYDASSACEHTTRFISALRPLYALHDGPRPLYLRTIGVSTLTYDVSSTCEHISRFILALRPLYDLHDGPRPLSMRYNQVFTVRAWRERFYSNSAINTQTPPSATPSTAAAGPPPASAPSPPPRARPAARPRRARAAGLGPYMGCF